MPRPTLRTLATACGLLLTATGVWSAGPGPARPAAVAWIDQVPNAATGLAVQAATDPIRALEQQVQQALVDARRQQEQLGQLRQRLAAAEAANGWLPWLVLALVGLGALALWLALRLRRLQQQAQGQAPEGPSADTLAAPHDAAADGAGRLLSSGAPVLSRSGALQGLAQAPATEPVLTLSQPVVATAPAVLHDAPIARRDFSLGTGVPPRPVSTEELLDLDQQADFFLVLGQEQAAVDLLLSHVRSTGGTHALPYFKLLEIYRQQGDEEAYERTRERFNQRFNAFAPDWTRDLDEGRPLEAYPELLERLQRAWPQPLRAVAELESLLLRRSDLEPLDLPAYRELLMLHALVRDLPAAPLPSAAPSPLAPAAVAEVAAGSTVVDMLLPLDEESPLEITRPSAHPAHASHAALPDSVQLRLGSWVFRREAEPAPPGTEAAASALDLDLGQRADAEALVDLDLGEPAPRASDRASPHADVAWRRDSRLSGLSGFDDSDLLPPPRGDGRH